MISLKFVVLAVVFLKHVFCLSTLYYPSLRSRSLTKVNDASVKSRPSTMRAKVLLFCVRHVDSPLCQKKSQRNSVKATRKEEGTKSLKTAKPSKGYRVGTKKMKEAEISSKSSKSSNGMVCQFTTKAEFLMFKTAVKVAKDKTVDVGRNLERIKGVVRDLMSLPRAFMKCLPASSATIVRDGEFLINLGDMVSRKKTIKTMKRQ